MCYVLIKLIYCLSNKSIFLFVFTFFVLKALNQLFEKIMELDIEERHLLRLGHGEEELQTEKDFSRYCLH